MYLKQKMRRGISAALVAAMTAGNILTVPAAPTEEGMPNVKNTVETESYQAELNLSDGEMVFKNKVRGEKEWNTADKAMIPGATMFLEGDNSARKADMTAANVLNSMDADGGAAGMQMSGELSGVKSWFFFDNEILCLGADIANTGDTTDKIINVVDNVTVEKTTYAGLTNPANGYRNILKASVDTNEKYSWKKIVDTATKGSHARNWLTASGIEDSQKSLEWSYVFGDTITNSKVFYRFPTEGTGEVKQFELWTLPVNGGYQYTLGAGKKQGDFANNAPAETENRVLENTGAIQAAENESEGTLAVNKWTDGEVNLKGKVAEVALNEAASVVIEKDGAAGKALITVAKPESGASSQITLSAALDAESAKELGSLGAAEVTTDGGTVTMKLDTAKMSSPVSVEVQLKKIDVVTGETITLVRGDEVKLETPEELTGNVTWSTKFLKYDGTYLRNVGSSKKKRELKEGETDGTRKAGDATADHLLSVTGVQDGAILNAKNKGEMVVVAADESGKSKQWKVKVLHEDPANLPEAGPEDYAKIRTAWKESLIGTNLTEEDGGQEILDIINAEAEGYWNAYAYKGQETCEDVPWKGDIGGGKENPDVPYEDDAVEFRPAFQKVLSMCKAYASEGGRLYHNQDMLKDIIHILDYMCTRCYVPKSQTDNWWTWEIGMPKDLIPALILIYDELSEEQIMKYTEALYFFQPDPYWEGAINTASTHVKGYRAAQGANIIDCSTTAVGLGALREDNELVYLGMMASSQTFVIQQVEDSTKLAEEGFKSGFYPDGSYMDHGRLAYLGSYGVEFMKGGVKIPSLIGGTPWQYPEEVQKNLEYYIVEGFGNGIYRGMMLDCLKGRSVARPGGSNRAAGREAMICILQMVDSLSAEARATILPMLKSWLEEDEGFIDSLQGAENMAIKKKAREILEDSSIEGYVAPVHKSYPLMDRAFHRMDDYLFAVSMFSERTQNTEIMNDENRFGWHQNDGMTYIYDRDDMYTENFWNTVNPLRLPGTTVAAMKIDNGAPDSSGFIQKGDFLSTESWVGGSSIGNYGISGMAFSGKIKGAEGDASTTYAPELNGKKSWFMFDDEIVCLGADINNKNMNVPVETTIDNRKLDQDGSNGFLVDGQEMDLPVKEANVKELADRSVDVSGVACEDIRWAHVEGTESAGTGYYFPEENTEIQVRRAKTTGSWRDIGTFDGESTENYLEMWFDHGENPTGASYSYVLLPETDAGETEAYAAAPEIAVLANNKDAQAVYHKGLNITGINFWNKNGGSVNDVTSSSAASVMLQESETGLLTVAVSDPTMKNQGTIQITIRKPIASEEKLDENVSCEQKEDGSVVLTFQMKGTNGASSMAELQLQASVYPAAVRLENGESQQFEVRDYGMGIQETSWSVSGTEQELAEGTTVDENGLLQIDEEEANNALVVTADTDAGAALQAYVSLGSPASAELPQEIQDLKITIRNALKAAEENGTDSEEAREAVKLAVEEIADIDNDKLIRYMMDDVLAVSELYQEAFAGNEYAVDEAEEVSEDAAELNPAEAQGMALSILPSEAEGPSRAVLVIGEAGEEDGPAATPSNAEILDEEDADIVDEDEWILSEDEEATPSNADFMENRKATASNADTEEDAPAAKATDSNAEEPDKKPVVPEKLGGVKVDADHCYSFGTQLFLEKEDGERNRLSMKAPICLEVTLPECIDPERKIVAAVFGENGKEYPLTWKLEEDRLVLMLSRTGTIVLANAEGEEPENPETELFHVAIDPDIPNGTVTANRLEGPEGTEIILKAVPDSRYRLNALYVNGKKVKTASDGTYRLILREDIEVTAEFRRKRSGGSGSSGSSSRGPAVSASGIWQNEGGRWKYRRADGSYETNSWSLIQNTWYCFDAEGYMRTGWYFETKDQHWYYLLPSGAMATGWQNIDGKWYFLNDITRGNTGWTRQESAWTVNQQQNPGMPQGALYQSGMTPDGYQVDSQGVWVQK